MITFTYKGIKSSDMGVIVEKQPPLATPYGRYTFFNIRGYDGTISHYAGKNAHQESYTILVVGQSNFDKVRAWLYGDGRFTRSDLPDRYRNVSFIQQTSYSFVTHDDGGIWRAEITLDVLDPHWYSTREATYADIQNSTFNVENKGNVASTPIIRLWAHDSVGDRPVTISSDNLSFTYTHQHGEQLILVDIDKGKAYLETGQGRDRFLTFETKKQKIDPGINQVSIRGVKSNIRFINIDKWL